MQPMCEVQQKIWRAMVPLQQCDPASDVPAPQSCRLAQEWHAWHTQSLLSSVETTALRCWYIRGWVTLLQWNHSTSGFFVAPHTLTTLMCLIAGLVCLWLSKCWKQLNSTDLPYFSFFFKVRDGKREIGSYRELFSFGNGRKKCFFFEIFFKVFVTSSFSVIYLHLTTCLCFVYILLFIFQFCGFFARGGGAHLLLLCIGSKFCLETVNMASLCVCGGVGVWRFWAL